VTTRELASLAAPGSEQAIQQILIDDVTAFTDQTLLSAAAATAAAPAGLLNGVAVSADLAMSIKTFFTNRPKAARPWWIVSPAAIGVLALEDRNVPATYRGYANAVTPAAGLNAILVDAAGIAVADGCRVGYLEAAGDPDGRRSGGTGGNKRGAVALAGEQGREPRRAAHQLDEGRERGGSSRSSSCNRCSSSRPARVILFRADRVVIPSVPNGQEIRAL